MLLFGEMRSHTDNHFDETKEYIKKRVERAETPYDKQLMNEILGVISTLHEQTTSRLDRLESNIFSLLGEKTD